METNYGELFWRSALRVLANKHPLEDLGSRVADRSLNVGSERFHDRAVRQGYNTLWKASRYGVFEGGASFAVMEHGDPAIIAGVFCSKIGRLRASQIAEKISEMLNSDPVEPCLKSNTFGDPKPDLNTL